MLMVSSCATEGLASLPLPAPGVGSGGYAVTAVFANALNLPANAKVKLGGAEWANSNRWWPETTPP